MTTTELIEGAEDDAFDMHVTKPYLQERGEALAALQTVENTAGVTPLPALADRPSQSRTGGLGPWETALRDVKDMYETFAARLYAEFPGTRDTAQDYAESWTLRHGTHNSLAGNPVTTWGYYNPEGQFIPIAHVSTPADLVNLGRRLYQRTA